MSEAELYVTHADGVATLWLNRPEKRNAVTHDMWRGIGDHANALASDDSVRALVVRGVGDHFCAGADIGGLQEMPLRDYHENNNQYADRSLAAFPKPSIASITGSCIGGRGRDRRVATCESPPKAPSSGSPPPNSGSSTRRSAPASDPPARAVRHEVPAVHRRHRLRRARARDGFLRRATAPRGRGGTAGRTGRHAHVALAPHSGGHQGDGRGDPARRHRVGGVDAALAHQVDSSSDLAEGIAASPRSARPRSSRVPKD